VIAAYLRRAQDFEAKQDFPRAIQELRDALKIEANNSDCHSRLGLIYIRTNQITMAKIHFNKALELNPQDAIALEGKQKLEAPNSKGTARKLDVKRDKPNPKAKVDPKGKSGPRHGKPDTKGGGGLFGLFGSKKK
jgi:tetratricopeptide (TPR) repeat protein